MGDCNAGRQERSSGRMVLGARVVGAGSETMWSEEELRLDFEREGEVCRRRAVCNGCAKQCVRCGTEIMRASAHMAAGCSMRHVNRKSGW